MVSLTITYPLFYDSPYYYNRNLACILNSRSKLANAGAADEVGPLEKRSIPQFHPINNVEEWRNVLINILPKSMIRLTCYFQPNSGHI